MFERPRRVIPVLLAVCLGLAAAISLAACGGSKGSSEDAQKIINETFSGQKNVDSGKLKLEVSAKIDASGPAAGQLKDPVKVEVSGPFQQNKKNPDALPQFDFDLTASAAGQSFTAGAVSTGNAGYISYQGTDYKVDKKTFSQFKKNFEKQQASDSNKDQPGLGALGVDPKKWISDPKDEGTEDVGGAQTNHVSANINVTAFLDDINNLLSKSGKLNLTKQQQQQLPKSIPQDTKQQIQDAIKEAKIEIWSGTDDRILRKLQVQFKFEVPDKLKSQAQGLEGGSIDLTVEVSDVNKPQTINAPKSSKPISELQDMLGSAAGLGALGGAGAGAGAVPTIPDTGSGSSGSGGGSSGGSSSGAPNTENAQKYLDCIQNANGKPEEIQKCADLLQQGN